MGDIIFVTGGRRSGKSVFAQKMAERMNVPRVYIATCPVMDDEMRARVEAHRHAREGKGWKTVEEPVNLARAIMDVGAGVALVECVTLWVNNLMYERERNGGELTETSAEKLIGETLDVCGKIETDVIFVTNEVGWGIVPDNKAARRFTDIAGKVNQAIASASDEAYLIVSGVPLKLDQRRKH